MKAVTIIKHFDILDYITSILTSGFIHDIIGPFGFQEVEKAFH